MARCALCNATYPDAEMLDHLESEHPALAADASLERWPDGHPVIFDHTLEPDDFETPDADL